ncbi:MAG: 16S rRNA (guanine(527)-N(7))-methyltransferase RsmG, partial [Actinobacteria bacterium]|nr:16S rRNA (guanine(527)-N(7))-methyltransferase RsmG [Actinomycetota bacterium]
MDSRETRAKRYFPERSEEALAFEELLATKAIERGLIGPAEGERIWQRHIENCLPVVTLLPMSEAKVADIGSGAGLPGIVVALARPELKVSLIEPLQRRVEFLYEVIEALKLNNVEVIRAKAESVKGSYNYVLARAVAPLPRLIESTWHLIAPAGSLLAIKGESAAQEM